MKKKKRKWNNESSECGRRATTISGKSEGRKEKGFEQKPEIKKRIVLIFRRGRGRKRRRRGRVVTFPES